MLEIKTSLTFYQEDECLKGNGYEYIILKLL